MTAAETIASDTVSADRAMPPVAGLFCSAEERAYWEQALTEALQEARQRISGGRVAPALTADVFRARLAEYDFATPRPLADTIPWVIEQMMQGIVQVTHPRYFGLFNPAPSLPAELAERIAAAFNPQLATSTTSPAAIEIERHVIRSIAERAGFPVESSGHFATGGSEANFTALICALTQANAAFVDRGMLAFGGAPSLYVSEDAHLAWYKIAVQCGIGHAGVRLVPTDASGRMDPAALSALIDADKRLGFIPVMISATAGTTGAGMIDPLHACAEIAGSCGLWYHIDAAWGGALIASRTMRGRLSGLERADSVTIDAHKWLATTMACSVFITRDRSVLKNAFFVDSYFMPPSDQEIDPHLTTVQWSRRFVGLRLFLSLATVGWQGHGEHVERSVALADLLARILAERGWDIPNGSQLGVVCAIPPDGFPPVRDMARAVVASGRAWISSSRFKGRDVLRICMTNGHSMPSDVVMLAELLDGYRQADDVSVPSPEASYQTSDHRSNRMDTLVSLEYKKVVNEICQLDWVNLTSDDMVAAAYAYYYFSIQFRENLEIARALFSDDPKLAQLEREECDTANLSPWTGVALPGERMNHDEFMRRALLLHPLASDTQQRIEAAGEAYLAEVRRLDRMSRALSITSYEDGGLEAVFRAILGFQGWDNHLLRAFEHFLVEHVRFDSDPEAGHGALSRHMEPDDRVLPLWVAFKDIFVTCVPHFQIANHQFRSRA